jgi:FkbM family methyltransferase
MSEDRILRCKECRHGAMLYNIHDLYIGRSFDLYGEYAEGEIELLSQLINSGDTVIDVGANIGAHSVFFAKQVGPNGRILSFEPQRLVHQILCANMVINQITWAECFHAGVGEVTGRIEVPELMAGADQNFGSLSLKNAKSSGGTPILRLDDLNLSSCKLMKVDVEGMEIEVLKGALNLIIRYQPILYVENDRKDLAEQLVLFIHGMGYKMYWHSASLFRENNYFGNNANVFLNGDGLQVVSTNMLCLPANSSIVLDKAFEEVKLPPNFSFPQGLKF